MKPNIELHIEELLLHGFKAGDRNAIAEAVEMELARLLALQNTPPYITHGGDFERVDAGQFEVRSNAKPDKVGSQIAQAVYKGFEK